VNQGLSAAAAPYLASAIGKHFDDLEKGPDGKTAQTSAGRLLAHAAAGAAVAYASGNHAGAGAVGGVSGEAMAMLVHQQLYDGKPVSELTQAEKENIRAVATLASGLVGGVAGDGFENAATAASAGYNAAVNNQLDESSTTQLGAWFCKVAGQGKCSDGAAAQEQKLETEKRMMALNPIKAGAIKQAISLGADFAPIIGDIKGFAEAETVGDYIFATVGVVPGVGDAIKSARTAYKNAKAAKNVEGMKNALEDVAQATQRAPIDYDGHILRGDVKSNGKVTGGHSTVTGEVRAVQGTESAPNAVGVYRAKIEVLDSKTGKWVTKSNGRPPGTSTMFPKNWSADKIKSEVDTAFANKTLVGNNKWEGVTPSGVKVEGFLTPKTTVYPKY
jgi:filamentous hemagglutinin